jgi:hypothetical protein
VLGLGHTLHDAELLPSPISRRRISTIQWVASKCSGIALLGMGRDGRASGTEEAQESWTHRWALVPKNAIGVNADVAIFGFSDRGSDD